jgi:ABC transporter with metal-binding/Fe-S-binding domain ATP-binding protein
MKLAALFSGGKDSTYSIHLVTNQGHEVKCLLSIFPKSEESHLLHHPNMKWTSLQSKSMKIPQITGNSSYDETDAEIKVMEDVLIRAQKEYGIEGIVHGGIKSNFQKNRFDNLCQKLNLKSFAPLWDLDAKQYLDELISSNFDFIITSVSSGGLDVSSGGLDDSWLGKKIGKNEIEQLQKLSERFGFNLNFEGGEAETFVLNCPLFSHPIEILKVDARLKNDVR